MLPDLKQIKPQRKTALIAKHLPEIDDARLRGCTWGQIAHAGEDEWGQLTEQAFRSLVVKARKAVESGRYAPARDQSLRHAASPSPAERVSHPTEQARATEPTTSTTHGIASDLAARIAAHRASAGEGEEESIAPVRFEV